MPVANFRRLFENVYFHIVEAPKAVADATIPASYLDVSDFERFAFIRLVGASDDTTVSFQVKQATAAAGTGSKDITGATFASTLLGSEAPNKYAVVEIETRKLDINNGFRFVAAAVAATGGSSTLGAILFVGWRQTGQNVYPTVQPADCAGIVYVDG